MVRMRTAALAAAAVTLVASAGLASPALADGGSSTTIPVTQTTNGYTLTLDVAGVGVVIDYTLDASGNVTTASTTTAGATVTSTSHEINVTMTDGTVVSVELGDGGTSVEEVSTEKPEASASPETSDQPEASQSPDASPSPEVSESPEASHSPEAPQSSDSSSTQGGDHHQGDAGATSGTGDGSSTTGTGSDG